MNQPAPSLETLAAEVAELRSQLAQANARRTRRHRALIAAIVIGASAAYAQLVSFAPNTPASAADVNANFALLKSWIEAKVGPVTVPVTGQQAVAASRISVSDLVALSETAYELSCGGGSWVAGTGVLGNPFCCRITVKTGAVSCAVASNANGTSWPATSTAYANLGATTTGRYHLSCTAGAPGASFPFCCRIDANSGATACGMGNTYSLGNAGTQPVSF
jgi:hypothetical protein